MFFLSSFRLFVRALVVGAAAATSLLLGAIGKELLLQHAERKRKEKEREKEREKRKEKERKREKAREKEKERKKERKKESCVRCYYTFSLLFLLASALPSFPWLSC